MRAKQLADELSNAEGDLYPGKMDKSQYIGNIKSKLASNHLYYIANLEGKQREIVSKIKARTSEILGSPPRRDRIKQAIEFVNSCIESKDVLGFLYDEESPEKVFVRPAN